MSDQETQVDPAVQEYLRRAGEILGEVMDHFIITGVPRLTPDQEEEGAMVEPVMHVRGNATLLCFVADQTAVHMHHHRLNAEVPPG